MRELLDSLFDRDASDVILSAGAPPVFRIDGQLERYRDDPLSPDDTDSLVRAMTGLSRLFLQYRAWFSDIEINPLIVLAQGVRAVDIRMVRRSSERERSHG